MKSTRNTRQFFQKKGDHDLKNLTKKKKQYLTSSSSASLVEDQDISSQESLEESEEYMSEFKSDVAGSQSKSSDIKWLPATRLDTNEGAIKISVSDTNMHERVVWIFDNWTHLKKLTDFVFDLHKRKKGCSYKPMNMEV